MTAGSPATLVCNIVSGTPTPEVRWRRKERKLPTGEEEIVGSTLTFSQVTRHHDGYYLCMADNGYGPGPEQKEVRLEVHYPPEIEVEESGIVTDIGEEQEIACIVHSSPPSEVTWKLDGAPLDDQSPNTIVSQNLNRHSLMIVAVSNESVGEYSCTANNSIGEATAVHILFHTECHIQSYTGPYTWSHIGSHTGFHISSHTWCHTAVHMSR